MRRRSDHWALSAVAGNVTFAGHRMIPWYLADPQTYSFLSVAEGDQLIEDNAVALADLTGSPVFVRVTTRPYPVSQWLDVATRNAADPQPGFDEMMARDAAHMAAFTQADKLVYYGVDLGARPQLVKALGRVSASAARREIAAVGQRLADVDRILAGPGTSARPCRPLELEWLLARSFALGCPVPVVDRDDTGEPVLDSDDLAVLARTSSWDADPLASSVRVTTSVGDRNVTRHVVVLTVSRIGEISIPESHEPWMAKTDRLPFPVEWSARIEPRDPREVSKEMTKQANRIDGQVSHWKDDHGKRPPKQLARQADRAADVEDEMRSEFTGQSTRTRGWYRIAVSGDTEDEALDRAATVIELYRPQIRVVRELVGQYDLAREFVPGEPLGSTAHVRHFPVLKVAAGLPAVTAEVGDRRGFHIGETEGLTVRPVAFDPWYLMEVVETGGLFPIVGTPGSGKSMFGSALCYKSVLSGAWGVGMDPSGRQQKMLALPELRGISRSIDVLGGRPGSLSPYAVVPEPNRELVKMDATPENLEEKLGLARNAVRATRRDLALSTLLGCLPLLMARSGDVQSRVRAAVSAAPDTSRASLWAVVDRLNAGDELSQDIAREVQSAAEREVGRLFFNAPTQTRDDVDRLAGIRPARFTVFNLKGLVKPDPGVDELDWSPEELLYRPIMSLAAWSCLNLIYRGDPHDRKFFMLDEAQEVTQGSGAGRALVYKLSSDSRKNNTASFVISQNASTILGSDINNFVGAAFVGRTQDAAAQRDALKLLGKPEGMGYEKILGSLSPRQRRSEEHLAFREFIYRDGLGGDGGRGGMEKIRVTLGHHPELFAALQTTADPTKRLSYLAPADATEGAA